LQTDVVINSQMRAYYNPGVAYYYYFNYVVRECAITKVNAGLQEYNLTFQTGSSPDYNATLPDTTT
jgi:hypothetical protein